MVASSFKFGPGITLTGGMTFYPSGVSGGGPQGSNGQILYEDMGPPIVPGGQLEDGTATVNGSTGFTINDSGNTGVAVINLAGLNETYFNNLGLGTHTATFGPGSSYSTASVDVTYLPGGGGPALVFFIDSGLTYPATFNFPISIS